MKTAGWSTQRVAGQVNPSECAVRNCWEQWKREGTCKEPLPAPGNRSNERRYREKDLATTGRKARNERGKGDVESRGREK
ncbi:hypothetical protein TNCV_1473831 [Trichonephila clavipes]|nr:hypothetical protein TNCV_1473831 [Trichonephila clavipes]